MIFTEFIKDSTLANNFAKTISIYPISESNLEGIKILIDNCIRMGIETNNNVEVATINPSIWLDSFLDKYWDKISHVSIGPNFEVLKLSGGEILTKKYKCDTLAFYNDEELDNFFKHGKWKKFVLFSIVKYADLRSMNTSYRIKFADITEKFEERDNKINDILS